MAYQEIDVQVVEIDLFNRHLVIKQRNTKDGKVFYKIIKWRLDSNTLVNSATNQTLSIADIKKDDRVTVDYIKTPQTGCLVKGITVLSTRK
jgi:hypothetical protein